MTQGTATEKPTSSEITIFHYKLKSINLLRRDSNNIRNRTRLDTQRTRLAPLYAGCLMKKIKVTSLTFSFLICQTVEELSFGKVRRGLQVGRLCFQES